jgi:hypothetical protein
MQNDKVSPTAVGTQIRGARKVNNDQVAIDVEMQKDKPLDDEDDDKGKNKSCMLKFRFILLTLLSGLFPICYCSAWFQVTDDVTHCSKVHSTYIR